MKSAHALPALAAALGLGFSLQAVAAQAQDAPPPPPAHMRGADHAGAWRDHAEHARAEHQHLLHDALGLRADQEPAWQAYLGSMTRPHEGPGHDRGEMEAKGEAGEHPLTTPERLDHMAARMAKHQAAFERHAAAVKTFYAVLSPQQQHTFDALAKLGVEGRHGMMGRDHGMGGPGGRGE